MLQNLCIWILRLTDPRKCIISVLKTVELCFGAGKCWKTVLKCLYVTSGAWCFWLLAATENIWSRASKYGHLVRGGRERLLRFTTKHCVGYAPGSLPVCWHCSVSVGDSRRPDFPSGWVLPIDRLIMRCMLSDTGKLSLAAERSQVDSCRWRHHQSTFAAADVHHVSGVQ